VSQVGSRYALTFEGAGRHSGRYSEILVGSPTDSYVVRNVNFRIYVESATKDRLMYLKGCLALCRATACLS